MSTSEFTIETSCNKHKGHPHIFVMQDELCNECCEKTSLNASIIHNKKNNEDFIFPSGLVEMRWIFQTGMYCGYSIDKIKEFIKPLILRSHNELMADKYKFLFIHTNKDGLKTKELITGCSHDEIYYNALEKFLSIIKSNTYELKNGEFYDCMMWADFYGENNYEMGYRFIDFIHLCVEKDFEIFDLDCVEL